MIYFLLWNVKTKVCLHLCSFPIQVSAFEKTNILIDRLGQIEDGINKSEIMSWFSLGFS